MTHTPPGDEYENALEALDFCIDPSQYDKHSGQSDFVLKHHETIRRALIDKIAARDAQRIREAASDAEIADITREGETG